MVLCAVGIFAVAAAVIVAKNELQRSSKVPALKVFNSQVADERYRMTKERAELLRRMIVAYGLVHGTAPESLDDLVPGFLPGIPAPLNGTDRWEYARTESNAEHPDVIGFTLSFRSWAHPLYRQERVNGEGQWSMAAE